MDKEQIKLISELLDDKDKFSLSGFGQSLVGSQEIKLQPAPTNIMYQTHPETSLCV